MLESRSDSYFLRRPRVQSLPVVFSSPHSGRDYDAAFLSSSLLSATAIRSSEDFFVDRIFSKVPYLGAPLITAVKPRAFLDLNRGADELDPAVIEGVVGRIMTPRILAGLGVVPRVVAGARAIYRGKIPRSEAERRLRLYWQPYHQELQRLIAQTREEFGEALVLDCHSMPKEAARMNVKSEAGVPDIILGDRYGASSRPYYTDLLTDAFQQCSFKVARNSPFAGGFITQNYGRPSAQVNLLQIEINRSIYMDEKELRLRSDFQDFRRLINKAIRIVFSELSKEKRLAAE